MAGWEPALALVLCLGIPAAIIWWMWRGFRASSASTMAEDDACPECGYDLRAGHRRCPECGTDVTPEALAARVPIEEFDIARLTGEWPDDAIEPVPPGDGEVLSLVFSTDVGGVISLLQQQLMARGVWCRVEEVDVSQVRGALNGPVSSFKFFVSEADRDRAGMIINGFRTAPAERV